MSSWSDLAPELQERVAQHLSANEVACSLKLFNKAAAELFRGATGVRLSEPVPPHAFVWRWGSPAAYRSLTLKSRRRLLALTASSGVLINLQVAIAAAGCWPDVSAFKCAAAGGHLHICQWFVEQDCNGQFKRGIACEEAAGNGHIAIVRWMVSSGYKYANERALHGAARTGREDVCNAVLKSLYETQLYGVPEEVLFDAAKGGHADLLLKLLEYTRVDRINAWTLLSRVAHGCDLATLQYVYDILQSAQGDWLQKLGLDGALLAALTSPSPDWHAKVDWLRARGGVLHTASHFELPQTLQPSDCVERARLLMQLVPEGDRRVACWVICRMGVKLAVPELVDFALGQGTVEEWTGKVNYLLGDLSTPGQAVVAAYLAVRGVPIWRVIVKVAISTGNLHVLQWMAAGAEADAPGAAAVAGAQVSELELLSGAGPDVRAAAAAALRARLEDSGVDLIMSAAGAGNLEVTTWLRAQGCAWNCNAFIMAARAGNVTLLQWMVDEGCPRPLNRRMYVELPSGILRSEMCSSGCYEQAIEHEDMAVLQFLRQMGLPWGPRERTLVGSAVRLGCRVELLAWLLEEGCTVDWEEARKAARFLEGNAAAAVRAWIKQSEP